MSTTHPRRHHPYRVRWAQRRYHSRIQCAARRVLREAPALLVQSEAFVQAVADMWLPHMPALVESVERLAQSVAQSRRAETA